MTTFSPLQILPIGGWAPVRCFTAREPVRQPGNRPPILGLANPRTGADVPAETHVEGVPIGRDEVLELVRDRLADILEIEPSEIAEGASFADDLDADSLALIELVEALEEELSERSAGFRIEDDDLEDLRTVRDAVDYVVSRLG